MIKLKLTGPIATAILLLPGSPMRVQASGSTPITIKDGGSILLHADGLDALKDWQTYKYELRHAIANGTLSSVAITDGGADQCGGKPTCGIDTSKSWKIVITFDKHKVTLSSVSGKQGMHAKFSHEIALPNWQKAATADEREFGKHGDGLHITDIKVNRGATNLCSGKGACAVTVTYTTP